MNILVVYPWDIHSLILQNNGAGRRVGSLVNFLRDNGHDLEVLSFGYKSYNLEQNGIIYRQIKAPTGLGGLCYWGISFLLGLCKILPFKLWLLFTYYEKCRLVKVSLQKFSLYKDAIFLEYPFAAESLKELADKVILTNHDVQSKAWFYGWWGAQFKFLEKRILEKEISALIHSRYAVLVSDEDRIFFQQYVDRPLSVIENPLILPKREVANANKNRRGCIFVGSGWFPNLDAVRFINDKIAPRCPNIQFTIIGTCCKAITVAACNVELLGVVDEVRLESEYMRHSVGLMPLFHGTGMSLKTLEALGRGLVIVSTPLGVRGLAFVDGLHGLLAQEADEFASSIHSVLSNPRVMDELSCAGIKLAKKYNHTSLYEEYLQMLREMELS